MRLSRELLHKGGLGGGCYGKRSRFSYLQRSTPTCTSYFANSSYSYFDFFALGASMPILRPFSESQIRIASLR